MRQNFLQLPASLNTLLNYSLCYVMIDCVCSIRLAQITVQLILELVQPTSDSMVVDAIEQLQREE